MCEISGMRFEAHVVRKLRLMEKSTLVGQSGVTPSRRRGDSKPIALAAQVVAISNSSELFGGRKPSALFEK
jgi:hypothetical protein